VQTNTDYFSSYDATFYTPRQNMILANACRIGRLVQGVTPFTSIAEFGCGSGRWISFATDDFGASKGYGIKGPWRPRAALDNVAIAFRPQD
jgi:hypothetical protein